MGSPGQGAATVERPPRRKWHEHCGGMSPDDKSGGRSLPVPSSAESDNAAVKLTACPGSVAALLSAARCIDGGHTVGRLEKAIHSVTAATAGGGCASWPGPTTRMGPGPNARRRRRCRCRRRWCGSTATACLPHETQAPNHHSVQPSR